MSILKGIVLPVPQSVPFARWAVELYTQLAAYNVPQPTPEAEWVSWATRVCELPVIAQLGATDPRRFGRWQDWAANLMQVVH